MPLAVDGAFIRSLGCLRCCATSADGSYDVYVADLTSESDAKRVVAQAVDGGGAGASHATAVVVFLEEPNFDDNAVTKIDTDALSALAQRALSTH